MGLGDVARGDPYAATDVQDVLVRIDLAQFDQLFSSRLPAQMFGEIQVRLELEDELFQLVSLIRG